MSRRFFGLLIIVVQILFSPKSAHAQTNIEYPSTAYQQVYTYVNPVLAGDHPDPTLLKVGSDFYMCGSSFHFAPNLPVLHSRDLLHWETISRVLPAGWKEMKKSAPGGGIWQGAISYFYDTYRIYFANSSGGGQYFATAPSPAGPWSVPVKVKGTAETGFNGYDNSVFLDDDGTPYLIIKSGQLTNRIQQIGHDGHLTGKLINLDWINANKRYSWAEGPVMCKKDGWYYYFPAGDVTGGEYVLRTRELTADSTKWERMGSVVAYADGSRPFPGANHISAPFRLADGTWWCIAQSYQHVKGDDWSGQGRQELLCQVLWDANGKPNILISEPQPHLRPNLPLSGGLWKLPRSDEFISAKLNLQWHFIDAASALRYKLNNRPGWLTITPGDVRSHLLQKEAGHYYTLVTKVANQPNAPGQEGGIYITSGNDSLNVKLYSGFSDGKRQIIFRFGKQQFASAYNGSRPVWLKIARREHILTAWYSSNGLKWESVGGSIDVQDLDKAQPNYNSWVGNSMGLFAEGQAASFDFFRYKDAYSELPFAGSNNYFGTVQDEIDGHKVTSAASNKGGWLMLGGVDFGDGQLSASKLSISAPATAKGRLEIWLNGFGNNGHKIGTIGVGPSQNGDTWQTVTIPVPPVKGQHDVYVRWVAGAGICPIKDIRFLPISESKF